MLCRWQDRLSSFIESDRELQALLKEDPQLLQELQRRAGQAPKYAPPPDPQAAEFDPKTYNSQVRVTRQIDLS